MLIAIKSGPEVDAILICQMPCHQDDHGELTTRHLLRACLKIAYFAQFLCWLKNLILEILNVFLRLNSSSALNLNKLSNFQTASKRRTIQGSGKF